MEEAVSVAIAPAGPVWVVDLWSGAAPAFGKLAAIQVEPRRWWLLAPADAATALAKKLADRGSVTPVGGGLLRATLTGPGWRAKLMEGGWFDAENPAFAIGHTAGTLIGHVPVRLHVVGADQCHAYFAASYDGAMRHHWHL